MYFEMRLEDLEGRARAQGFFEIAPFLDILVWAVREPRSQDAAMRMLVCLGATRKFS